MKLAKSNIFKRNIKHENIYSSFLQTEKEILISHPPELEEGVRYPFLLLHDGDDYFRLGRLITLSNQLIAEQRLRPLLLVAIPVKKSLRTQEYSPTGKNHQAHLQFVAHELLPLLLQKYPVLTSKQERVIAGSSLGGTAALHFALQFPELCHRVLTQSGAFSHNTVELISQSPLVHSMQVYQSVGLAESSFVSPSLGEMDLVARNREVFQALKAKEADVKKVEREGNHTWGLWQTDLPEALQYFFAPTSDNLSV